MSYDEPIKVLDKQGLRLEVKYEEFQDEHLSPRAWDNLTTILCFHKRYNIGDSNPYSSDQFSSWSKFREQLENDHDIVKIKPLYMYNHSGITISTTPFRSSWDSGQVGWVFITKEDQEKMGTPDDKLDKVLKGEIETYDKYIRGEVYRYRITDKKTNEVLDSCTGFFDTEVALDQAKCMLESILQQRKEERQAKIKSMIENGITPEQKEKALAELN